MMKVAALACYPVKSLRGHSLQRATIDRIGIAGDRRWAVVNHGGRFQTQRELPAMATIDVLRRPGGITLVHCEHGRFDVPVPDARAEARDITVWRDRVPVRMASAGADTFVSAVLGRPLRLAFLDNPEARPIDPAFATGGEAVNLSDGFPLLVTTRESLDDLNRRLANPLQMRRFRPNIVIEGGEAWAEDRWRRLRIGDLELRIVKPCARCSITTLDPLTGTRRYGDEPLTTLRGFHRAGNGGIIFGQNAIPADAGEIAVGDAVELLEEGPSNLG
jgi:uncharacterized protein YcbX